MIIALAALSLFAQDPSEEIDCSRTAGDLEMTACAGRLLDRQEEVVQRYLLAARDHQPTTADGAPTQARGLIEASQAAWTAYAEIACQAAYEAFGEGSVRNLIYLDCRIQMANERAYRIWSDYLLGGNDGPVLPQPAQVVRQDWPMPEIPVG